MVMLKRASLILLWRMMAIIEKRFVFHNDPPVFSWTFWISQKETVRAMSELFVRAQDWITHSYESLLLSLFFDAGPPQPYHHLQFRILLRFALPCVMSWIGGEGSYRTQIFIVLTKVTQELSRGQGRPLLWFSWPLAGRTFTHQNGSLAVRPQERKLPIHPLAGRSH